jgi:hypothetical protein
VTPRTRRSVAVISAVALAAVVLVAVALMQRHRAGSAHEKDARPASMLAVSEIPPEPSVWVDVHSPDRVWKWARSNAWLARASAEPLGQGLAASWAGFLGTRGQEIAGAFDGVVLDVLTERLLASPFRLVYFAGPSATGAPALVVPHPPSAAITAYDLLEGVARRGSFEAEHCPGPTPKKGQPQGPPISVSRWLVADHPVFAGQRDGRIALGKSPDVVIQALCAAPPDVPATQGIDVSLSFSRDALGREAQLAAELLGLGPAPRLGLAVEGDRLVPRGLLGDLSEPGRLDAAAPPQSLLRLLPADAGVVLVATLRLPEKLDKKSLARHLGKTYQGPYAARPIAVVWNPRGAEALPTEVALVWPSQDGAALREAFTGPNRMEHRRACGHEIFASTGGLAALVEKACAGKSPSLLDAAPPVVQGLKQPVSVGLDLNVGVLLSRLAGDAWTANPDAKNKPAPEIEAARRLLEELPFFGLHGVAKGSVLVPGGFRS